MAVFPDARLAASSPAREKGPGWRTRCRLLVSFGVVTIDGDGDLEKIPLPCPFGRQPRPPTPCRLDSLLDNDQVAAVVRLFFTSASLAFVHRILSLPLHNSCLRHATGRLLLRPTRQQHHYPTPFPPCAFVDGHCRQMNLQHRRALRTIVRTSPIDSFRNLARSRADRHHSLTLPI